LATAYYAYSTQLVAKAAHVLGNEKDAEEYEQLFGKIKEAFNREFITPSGRFSSNTQTAYVLGLAFGLVPEEQEDDVAERLAADIEKFGHITTGFLGTPLICHMLTKYGYTDLAYMLLNRTEYPSWLYPVTKGATTIWERWDGIKPDGSFQNAGMNSFNHYAYGAIGDWLFRTVAGINQLEPGFKKFSIRPEPGGALVFARAKYESVYGTIRSEWRINDDATVMQVEVPANTTAVVHLPQATVDQVKESGLPLQEAEGVVIQGERDGALVVEVGSGMYNFSIAK
jgi:alpha-L-rhamnosidase